MRRAALISLVAPFLLALPAAGQNPAPAPAGPPPMAGHAHAMGPGAAGSCGDMCAAMMARMDSANARLATLVEAMNAAKGSKKTDAMAAVINAMAQDRLEMQSMMKMMHEHMMGMMHGGMGGMGAGGCQPGMPCCQGQAGCAAPPAAAPDKKE